MIAYIQKTFVFLYLRCLLVHVPSLFSMVFILDGCLIHFTMEYLCTYGVNQAFRVVECIWLHRKNRKRPILHHTYATWSELPSYISTMLFSSLVLYVCPNGFSSVCLLSCLPLCFCFCLFASLNLTLYLSVFNGRIVLVFQYFPRQIFMNLC